MPKQEPFVFRYDELGALDEVCIDEVSHVHLEYMDDNSVWIGVYLKDKRRVCINLISDEGHGIQGSARVENLNA